MRVSIHSLSDATLRVFYKSREVRDVKLREKEIKTLVHGGGGGVFGRRAADMHRH